MADSIDGSSWMLELESALLDDCDLNVVRKICNGKSVPDNVRVDFWQVCLGVKGKRDTLTEWDDMYDLPEQSKIRDDCKKLVDRLGNDEEDKLSVVSDLESVLTNYCKSTKQPYCSTSGWLDLLQPLIALRLPKQLLYNCFYAIQSSYIPRHCDKNGHPFNLLRLLLLYHDPELCSFLDTKKITVDTYAGIWFQSLFSASCDLKVTLNMWDIYLQLADPFFIFFLALVILVNAKEQLFLMKDDSKQSIIEFLQAAPCALEAEDVEDFCSLAQYYASRTPQSFSKDYHVLIFGPKDLQRKEVNLSQALCLPVSVHELLLNKRLEMDSKSSCVRYFIVDCRPADQYNAGHLSTAFHLDANLMLLEPAAFHTAVQALFAAQKQALAAESVAGGEHLCFMGSGREEEDQYVHMVVASFLQKHVQFVSLATGGYAALHELLSEDLPGKLTDHNTKLCIACNSNLTVNGANCVEEEISFLNKLSTVVMAKIPAVKEKLVEYITNPQVPVDRHVSSTDRVGKRYRAKAPIFSIDDDEEDCPLFASDEEAQEEVNIQSWTKKTDVMAIFKCHEIKENGLMFISHLIVTQTHLYVLRENPHKKGHALIVARRPLVSIMKITSKKKHPELITFKYGHSDDSGEFTVTAMDRLLIAEPGDATKLIKQQIVKLTDFGATENR